MTDPDIDHRRIQLDEGFLQMSEMFELNHFKELVFFNFFFFVKVLRDSLACGFEVGKLWQVPLSPVVGTCASPVCFQQVALSSAHLNVGDIYAFQRKVLRTNQHLTRVLPIDFNEHEKIASFNEEGEPSFQSLSFTKSRLLLLLGFLFCLNSESETRITFSKSIKT